MNEFFTTIMGRKFFEGTIPRIASALERIAKQLEESAKAKKAAEPLQVSDRSGRIIVLGTKGETGTWSSDAEVWVLNEGTDLDVDTLDRGTMAKQTVTLDDLIAAYEILYGRKV